MSLVALQAEFLLDACHLIEYATSLGFAVTGGELFRTPEQQKIYVDQGKSKTQNSQHLQRLAIDLNFFKDGELVQDRETLKPIGMWWEDLHPKNRWGASWHGLVDAGKSNFIDLPHFERQV